VENKVSIYRVFAIFVFGEVRVTTQLIRYLNQYGISLFFLKQNFETYGHILAHAEGNYLLRRNQYLMSEEKEHRIAQQIVRNKIHNQLDLLRSIHALDTDVRHYKSTVTQKIERAGAQKELLGIEGSYSKWFFPQYFNTFDWWKRMPRVKPDIPNLLLDIGYSYLFHFVDSLLRLHGFDPFKGCYHQLFFARRSLACDLTEPFRGLVDRRVRTAYNLGQINESDFKRRYHQVILPRKNSAPYNQMFLKLIMDHKEDIFVYVREFYRHIMDSEHNQVPFYKIKVK